MKHEAGAEAAPASCLTCIYSSRREILIARSPPRHEAAYQVLESTSRRRRSAAVQHIIQEESEMMRTLRRMKRVFTTAAASVAALSIAGGPAFAGKPRPPAPMMPIEHVVVVFQENVSFDHYFATYPVAANTDGSPFLRRRRYAHGQWAKRPSAHEQSQFQQPRQQHGRQLRDQPVSPEPF